MNIQDVKDRMHHYEDGDHKVLIPSRYGNSRGFAWCYTAVLMFSSRDGSMIDWGAYLGGCDLAQREEQCVRWVANYGNKVLRRDAEYIFPYFPSELYRG